MMAQPSDINNILGLSGSFLQSNNGGANALSGFQKLTNDYADLLSVQGLKNASDLVFQQATALLSTVADTKVDASQVDGVIQIVSETVKLIDKQSLPAEKVKELHQSAVKALTAVLSQETLATLEKEQFTTILNLLGDSISVSKDKLSRSIRKGLRLGASKVAANILPDKEPIELVNNLAQIKVSKLSKKLFQEKKVISGLKSLIPFDKAFNSKSFVVAIESVFKNDDDESITSNEQVELDMFSADAPVSVNGQG